MSEGVLVIRSEKVRDTEAPVEVILLNLIRLALDIEGELNEDGLRIDLVCDEAIAANAD